MSNQFKLEDLLKEHAPKYAGMPIALSGGVDSSTLAALIKPKFAISVRLPEDERFNEIKYSALVCDFLKLKHVIVDVDVSNFEAEIKEAVKAIGRPIPHFNIFPLYKMYQRLAELGEKDLVLGDGPDETMCGYGRDLILNYLYKVYSFEAFENYKPLIGKILPPFKEALERVTDKKINFGDLIPEDNYLEMIVKADMDLMRPDMDDMSNALAKHFGITNHRPYQDNLEIDNFMRELPEADKIDEVEWGKYALRQVAQRYLPHEIAWRLKKVGGPVFPINEFMGWQMTEGDFGKGKWMEYQQNILDEAKRNNN